MRTLVALPTMTRKDLLIRNKGFLETLQAPDMCYIVDNGGQEINIKVPVERHGWNLGIAATWNRFLRLAFVHGDFDLLVILQDDIIWDAARLAAAKRLAAERTDVDLFLSYMQFSVQVHRKRNLQEIGYYDERFYPAYCEDDDYALTMIEKGKVYERFHELDPLPGSIIEGTAKAVPWKEQEKKLIEKWGRSFGVNLEHAPWFKTNRGITL